MLQFLLGVAVNFSFFSAVNDYFVFILPCVTDEHHDPDGERGGEERGDDSVSPRGGDQGHASSASSENSGRFVRYKFSPHFLKLKQVGAT